MNNDITIKEFIKLRNSQKHIFTAGPAALCEENIIGLESCFGRGDKSYSEIEDRVMSNLKKLTGHKQIARMQGSGSMALEVMISNFAYGKVLVVDTGYYSERVKSMANIAKQSFNKINSIKSVHWENIEDINQNFDWIIACYTETSLGLKIDIRRLKDICKKIGGKLMLDATASIGIEKYHEYADTISFSSCKGLFGLTGGAFVSFNTEPDNEIKSFNLSLKNHLNKMMTGPYHSICSLDLILNSYNDFLSAVKSTKLDFLNKFNDRLVYSSENQPTLCTLVKGTISTIDSKSILYIPRTLEPGYSVVCHLGDVYLKSNKGEINNNLRIS